MICSACQEAVGRMDGDDVRRSCRWVKGSSRLCLEGHETGWILNKRMTVIAATLVVVWTVAWKGKRKCLSVDYMKQLKRSGGG